MTSRFDNLPLEDLLAECGRFGHVDLKRNQYVGRPRSSDTWQCEIRLPTHHGPNIQRAFGAANRAPRLAVLAALMAATEWAASDQRQIDRERYLDSVQRHRAYSKKNGRDFADEFHGELPDIDV